MKHTTNNIHCSELEAKKTLNVRTTFNNNGMTHTEVTPEE